MRVSAADRGGAPPAAPVLCHCMAVKDNRCLGGNCLSVEAEYHINRENDANVMNENSRCCCELGTLCQTPFVELLMGQAL